MAKEIISGVGRNARRTDRNISSTTTQPIRKMKSQKYGEGKALLQQQQAAPMAGQPKTPKITAAPSASTAPIVPLTAETQRPDEAPELGLPFGEGPGPEIFGSLTPEPESLTAILGRMVNADASGEVKAIYENALLNGE